MIEIIKTFYEKNKRFGYLKDIHLLRDITDEGCTDYQINLILTNYPYYEGDEIFNIIFKGVKDIKIGKLDGLLKLVFEIRDLSSDCLENIKFRVYESENEILSFYCNEIIIV